MQYKDLDLLIRSHTDKENKYLIGWKNPDYTTIPQIEVDGMTVSRLTLDMISTYDHEQNIFINKHDRFHEHPIHSHPAVEINYIYDGKSMQNINGAFHTLTKGQVLIMDCDTIHKIEPLSENDVLLNIIISKKYFDAYFINDLPFQSNVIRDFLLNTLSKKIHHNHFMVIDGKGSRRLRVFFSELYMEHLQPSANTEIVKSNLLNLIFTELVDIYEHEIDNSPMNSRQTYNILKYIASEWRNITLKDTAEHFSLNSNYLSNLLKDETGYAFQEIVIQHRMKYAATLLRNTDLTIGSIAEEVDYSNQTYFYKKFKMAYGKTPAEYRKSFQYLKVESPIDK